MTLNQCGTVATVQLEATQRLETPRLPPPAIDGLGIYARSVFHEREPMAWVESKMFVAQFLAMDMYRVVPQFVSVQLVHKTSISQWLIRLIYRYKHMVYKPTD